MQDSVISDDSSNLFQYWTLRRKRFFRGGVWFWILAWYASILVYQPIVVNLKGCWGMRFFVGTGSVGVMIDSYSTGAFNYFKVEEPLFLWSQPFLEKFHQHPGDLTGMLGRVGWSGYGYDHTIAFPIAGFLWLWLIAGWMGDFRKSRSAEIRKNGRMFLRATILAALPLVILVGDYKGRRAEEIGRCVLVVRNIQQAIRAYEGMNDLYAGESIVWSDLMGPGKMLGPYSRKCPSGQDYRLISKIPEVGVLAAECPNPEHQRRIKAQNTSEW